MSPLVLGMTSAAVTQTTRNIRHKTQHNTTYTTVQQTLQYTIIKPQPATTARPTLLTQHGATGLMNSAQERR